MIPPYVSLKTISGWIVMLLVATTLVAWMAVGFDIADARVLTLEAAGRLVEPAEKRAYALTGAALLALQVALYGALATGFIIWTYAARSNLRALGARRLDYTTEWAVAGWFVPVLNLVRPYQVIAEIWKASDPATTEAVAWKKAATPPLLQIWWLVFVAFACLEIVVLIAALSAGDVPAEFRFARGVSILADAGAAVAATLAYFVVTKITDAQDEKWDLREQYRAIDEDLLVLTAEKRTAPEPKRTRGRAKSRIGPLPSPRPPPSAMRRGSWRARASMPTRQCIRPATATTARASIPAGGWWRVPTADTSRRWCCGH